MSTKLKTGLCAMALALLLSCATRVRVTASTAEGIDLSRYKTFSLKSHPVEGGDPRKVEIERLLESDVKAELLAHGMQAAHGDPDMIFSYSTERQTRHQSYATRREFAGENNWSYQEGALVINARDFHTGAIVWTAHAQTVIDPSDPAHQQLKTAIRKAFKNYPYIRPAELSTKS
jgi:hypothetical protein